MPLESYAIGKVIGKGSYGEVCLVKHRKDRKQVSFYSSLEKIIVGFEWLVAFKNFNKLACISYCSADLFSCYLQYVMKKVDLSKASSKERKAAEQEVKIDSIVGMG